MTKRVAGLHITKSCSLAVVWIEHEPEEDSVLISDLAVFDSEEKEQIAESIMDRGRIPIAWTNKEISDTLLDLGCRMLAHGTSESDEFLALQMRDVTSRLRNNRLKHRRHLVQWAEQARAARAENFDKDSVPLITATAIALANLDSAKAKSRPPRRPLPNYAPV